MDELIAILDSEGCSTGETALRSEAHKKGWFHATVHIWLFTKNQKILIQQRGKYKDTYPLLLDVSVAGHVNASETIETAALREVKEEIGLLIEKTELHKVGVFKSIKHHSAQLIDCEFHHTFLCELKVSLNELKKQENEVAELMLIPISQFSEDLLNSSILKKYVPHTTKYYTTIVKALRKKLKRF